LRRGYTAAVHDDDHAPARHPDDDAGVLTALAGLGPEQRSPLAPDGLHDCADPVVQVVGPADDGVALARGTVLVTT